MRKKLIVTGCSFSAPSLKPEFAGTSYPERLADKLGWDLVHLARQGMGNGAIRITIDEILRQRPDFVIVAPTSYDRIEIPANKEQHYDWNKTDYTRFWGNDLQEHLLNESLEPGYDPRLGVNNINYGDNNSRLISETIWSLAQGSDHAYRKGHIDNDTQTAMKYYVNYLYDGLWKKQIDEWIILEGIFELYHAGIPFSVDPNLLWTPQSIRSRVPQFIPDQYLRIKEEETITYATNKYELKDKKNDPGYHAEPESQEYLADVYVDIIKNQWKL